MCNAYNHSSGCTCGFGGEGHLGRASHYGHRYSRPQPRHFAATALSFSAGTVESYVDPNARCPVCDAPVFYYRSPYDGRVFFDELGPPWPKHGCTDRKPERAPRPHYPASTPPSMVRRSPRWAKSDWVPLLHSSVMAAGENWIFSGQDPEVGTWLFFVATPPQCPLPNAPLLFRPDLEEHGKYRLATLYAMGGTIRGTECDARDGLDHLQESWRGTKLEELALWFLREPRSGNLPRPMEVDTREQLGIKQHWPDPVHALRSLAEQLWNGPASLGASKVKELEAILIALRFRFGPS